MMEKTILLVEDNQDDQVLTLRAFKKNNIDNRIVVVRDGQEALDCLFGVGEYEGSPLAPQIILLDLNLPRIDGLEFLRRIRGDRRTRLFPVVVLTSSREESDLLESYNQGANSYIRKPVDFNEFSRAVRQLGDYWLALNEAPPQLDFV